MGKIVVITGGSRGIGAATARVLAGEGYDVAVNYVANADSAAAVVADIEAVGQRAISVQADTGNRAAVRSMFEAVDRALGPVTHLVNNASVITQRGPFEDISQDSVERMLAVNVAGYLYCCQEAIQRMSTRHGGKGGAIVNVFSGSAHLGSANDSILYAMTKGAVNSLTIGLSQEMARHGVRVNTVSPGLIATEMPPADKLAALGPRLPMGRPGEATEIAHGIAIYSLTARATRAEPICVSPAAGYSGQLVFYAASQ